MDTHFIGCTHFGHESLMSKFAKRPFKSVAEMDETLIENWNSVVKKRDTVYHLGDFGYRETRSILDRLNGTTIRLQGNHDPRGWGNPYIEIKGFGPKIVLCHYPFEEWNGWFRGALHIHAHTHKPELISAERRFNVCAEAVNYTPISIDQIMGVADLWR